QRDDRRPVLGRLRGAGAQAGAAGELLVGRQLAGGVGQPVGGGGAQPLQLFDRLLAGGERRPAGWQQDAGRPPQRAGGGVEGGRGGWARCLRESASLAARAASSSSDLAPLRRAGRAGRSTSTTHSPCSSRKVVRPAPKLPVPSIAQTRRPGACSRAKRSSRLYPNASAATVASTVTAPLGLQIASECESR